MAQIPYPSIPPNLPEDPMLRLVRQQHIEDDPYNVNVTAPGSLVKTVPSSPPPFTYAPVPRLSRPMGPGLIPHTTLDRPMGPPQIPANPLLAEIDRKHAELSPPAQQAIAMSGVPIQLAPMGLDMVSGLPHSEQPGAPSPVPFASPAIEAKPLGGSAAPLIRGGQMSSDYPAQQGELQRITQPPLPTSVPRINADGGFMRMQPNPLAHTSADTGQTGIGQIHNKPLRIAATVGDALLGGFFPSVAMGIPGTTLHHNMLVREREGLLNEDAKRQLEGSQSEEAQARAVKESSPAALTNDFELWARQNPNAPVSEWLKLQQQFKPDRSETPFDVWRKQNPDAAAEDWLKLEESTKQHNPNEYADFRDGYLKQHPQATADEVVKQYATAHQAPQREPINEYEDFKNAYIKTHPKADATEVARAFALAKQPPERPGAADSRNDKSYQFHTGKIDAAAKPVEDAVARLGRLQETLRQGTPQADALVAPELLTVMAGGAGSGLRMNEAEISRIVGGRSHWEDLKAAVQKWSTDPKAANSITADQRQQIRSLVGAVTKKLQQKQAAVDEARDRLFNSDDPKEHRAALNDLHHKLTAVDSGAQEQGGGTQQLTGTINGKKMRYKGTGDTSDLKNWEEVK